MTQRVELKMFKLIENKFLNTPMNKNLSNSDLAIVRDSISKNKKSKPSLIEVLEKVIKIIVINKNNNPIEKKNILKIDTKFLFCNR